VSRRLIDPSPSANAHTTGENLQNTAFAPRKSVFSRQGTALRLHGTTRPLKPLRSRCAMFSGSQNRLREHCAEPIRVAGTSRGRFAGERDTFETELIARAAAACG
jgi:hypothetical protein